MCRREGSARTKVVPNLPGAHRAAEARMENVAEEREREYEHEYSGHDQGAKAHHERHCDR